MNPSSHPNDFTRNVRLYIRNAAMSKEVTCNAEVTPKYNPRLLSVGSTSPVDDMILAGRRSYGGIDDVYQQVMRWGEDGVNRMIETDSWQTFRESGERENFVLHIER
jgi:hypothetical protein